MKKIVSHILLVIVLSINAVLLTACDESPMKPGGGGHSQPYDPSNGQYK